MKNSSQNRELIFSVKNQKIDDALWFELLSKNKTKKRNPLIPLSIVLALTLKAYEKGYANTTEKSSNSGLADNTVKVDLDKPSTFTLIDKKDKKGQTENTDSDSKEISKETDSTSTEKINIISPPEHGKVVVNPDGTVTYIPDENAQPGADSMIYTIQDSESGDSKIGIISFEVGNLETQKLAALPELEKETPFDLSKYFDGVDDTGPIEFNLIAGAYGGAGSITPASDIGATTLTGIGGFNLSLDSGSTSNGGLGGSLSQSASTSSTVISAPTSPSALFTNFADTVDFSLVSLAQFNATTNPYDALAGNDTVLLPSIFNAAVLGYDATNTFFGGSGNDDITGFSLNDIIDGGSGNDTLSGGSGINTLSGGLGDDTYTVTTATDTLIENASEGTDLVNSSVTFTLASNLENLTLLGSTNIDGTGNTIDNIITGNTGDNTLSGGSGNDTLIGGAGEDTMDGGADTDTISYLTSTTGLTIDLTNTANSTSDAFNDSYANVEILRASNNSDTIILSNSTSFTSFFGQASADSFFAANITGSTATLLLDGGAGTDSISYLNLAVGTDSISANLDTNSVIIAVSGAPDDLNNLSNIETIIGTNNNDFFSTTVSSLNSYSIHGEGGTDRLTFSSASSGITFDLTSAENSTIVSNIEELEGSANNDTLTGGSNSTTILAGAGNDVVSAGDGGGSFQGDAGDDTLNAGSSADAFDGGTDTDTVSYINSLNNLTIDLDNTANSTFEALNDSYANVETLQASSNNDTVSLSTTTSFRTFMGEDGNDTFNMVNITGTGAILTLDGGNGSDTINYQALAVTDSIIANLASDSITITSSAPPDETNNLSNFETIDGSNQNDSFSATDSSLHGYTINAQSGTDRLSFSAATTGITFDLNAAELASTVSSIEELQGSSHNDNLTGSATNNNLILGGAGNDDLIAGNGGATLRGEAGDDTLTSGGGTNIMEGGLDNDIYFVGSALDTVTENVGEGTDEVRSAVTYTLTANVENLTLLGIMAINGTGNSLANTITGNSNDNTIDGGSNADIMSGNDGNDIYIVDNAADVINENASEGTDQVNTNVDYTLSANVENITAIGGSAAANLTGNNLGNIITANTNNSTLQGLGGDDTINGSTGDDTLEPGDGSDILDGGAGTDTADYSNFSELIDLTLTTLSGDGTTSKEDSIGTPLGTDTLSNFEFVIGSANNDSLNWNRNEIATAPSGSGADGNAATADIGTVTTTDIGFTGGGGIDTLAFNLRAVGSNGIAGDNGATQVGSPATDGQAGGSGGQANINVGNATSSTTLTTGLDFSETIRISSASLGTTQSGNGASGGDGGDGDDTSGENGGLGGAGGNGGNVILNYQNITTSEASITQIISSLDSGDGGAGGIGGDGGDIALGSPGIGANGGAGGFGGDATVTISDNVLSGNTNDNPILLQGSTITIQSNVDTGDGGNGGDSGINGTGTTTPAATADGGDGGDGGDAIVTITSNQLTDDAGFDNFTITIDGTTGSGGTGGTGHDQNGADGVFGNATATISFNTLSSGADDDTLTLSAIARGDSSITNVANNILNAGTEDDTITLTSQALAGTGASGDARLQTNTVNAGSGNDSITLSLNASGAGIGFTFIDNIINGDDDNDNITISGGLGGSNNDYNGGNGDDTITIDHRGTGNDFNGDAGTDTLVLNMGVSTTVDLLTNNRIYDTGTPAVFSNVTGIENVIGSDSSTFFDDIFGSNVANVIDVRDGQDFVNGNGGDDTISGGAGNDILTGDDGNDTIDPGSDADNVNGGNDIDTITYVSSAVAIVMAITTTGGDGSVNEGGLSIDSISNFETHIGSNLNDTMTWIVPQSGNSGVTGGIDANGTNGDSVSVAFAQGATTSIALQGADGDDTLSLQSTLSAGSGGDGGIGSNGANGSNGSSGGSIGGNGTPGDPGNPGGNAGTAGSATSTIGIVATNTVTLQGDNGDDTIDLTVTATSGAGGNGGTGGTGGNGGNGGTGSVLPGSAGNGGTGGAGGSATDGEAATITVSELTLTAGSDNSGGDLDVILTATAAAGGRGGDGGDGGNSGTFGIGGTGVGGSGGNAQAGANGGDAQATLQNTTITGDAGINIVTVTLSPTGGQGGDGGNGGDAGTGLSSNGFLGGIGGNSGDGGDATATLQNISINLNDGADTITLTVNAINGSFGLTPGTGGTGNTNGANGVTGSNGQRTITFDNVDVNGGAGNDIINLDIGASDTLTFINSDISGDTGDDTIQTFIIGNGNVYDGGADTDTFSVENNSNPVTINLGTNTVTDSTGTSTIQNIENITGSQHADNLTGDALANIIDGQSDDDIINGGAGADILNGGANDDNLTGGADNDTFVFIDGNTDKDTINDFANNGLEKIDLTDFGFAGIGSLTINNVGGDVIIFVGGGESITLIGLQDADLDASDFLF